MKTTAELFQVRAEQLLSHEGFLNGAYRKRMEARSESVRYWDQRMAHSLRKNQLQVWE